MVLPLLKKTRGGEEEGGGRAKGSCSGGTAGEDTRCRQTRGGWWELVSVDVGLVQRSSVL